MANKREKEKRESENAKKFYKNELKKLIIYVVSGGAFIAAALLLCFCDFVYVDNPASGVEKSVNGWMFFRAFLSGNYTAVDKSFGDLAVPFYYYAKNACETMGFFTFAAIMTSIVSVVFAICFICANKGGVKKCSLWGASVCSAVSTVCFLITFIAGLSVKNSKIVSDWCRNPACSIQSLAVFAALSSGAATAFMVFALIKSIKTERRLLA